METNKKPNTTIAISQQDLKRLEGFVKRKGISKKDFITISLDFFERTGLDPSKHESPKAELEKVLKRIDQIIAFIKTQEKETIRPSFEAIVSSEERIKNDLSKILKIEHFNDFIKGFNAFAMETKNSLQSISNKNQT
ncbi:BfmA/BtgA family mobilization protein [Chryseobacterium sp.]|uniref:BfmA/BtgA family mobilization protein n=1 Tax=Chryseobacterium sp. TaxID=1871047 RepID=UPI00289D13CC|nr:BfmA/BtgA family mobilization protein [Chryseobacterium sp.]